MKKLMIAVLTALLVAIVLPSIGASAKTKKHLPKNGEKFTSETFAENELTKKSGGKGYWKVYKRDGEKRYKPVVEVDGVEYFAPKMYVKIGKYLYYTNKYGEISFGKNPEGYTVSKYGYCVTKKQETKDPTPTTDDKKQPTDTTPTVVKIPAGYTVKVDNGVINCYDEKGYLVTGFVGPYYFYGYGSGLAIGINFIDGEYYYFSNRLEDFGQMQFGLVDVLGNGSKMFFGSDGKALRSQKITLNGKTYYLGEYGYLQTGWVGNEYYSAEPDRYGELVYTR